MTSKLWWRQHRQLIVVAFGLAWAGVSCATFAQQPRLLPVPSGRRRLDPPLGDDEHAEQLTVALRAVVLSDGTRIASLNRLLYSLCLLVSDGDRIDVDVWIDVPPGATATGAIAVRRELARDIEQLGINGTYRYGRMRAHVWEHHVGLRGQWLDAWHRSIPGGLTAATTEIGLMLEDDLELSPLAWRWLKAAHEAYGNDRRVAGFSLQRLELCAAHCDDLKGGPDNAGGAFLYPVVGTWGYSPRAESFASFRHWYYRQPADFRPYVQGISPTDWYVEREKDGSMARMWSMHHIYYTHTHEDKYTVYVKCPDNQTLAVNHLEVGLNYQSKEAPKFRPLNAWDQGLVNFPKDPYVLNYSGVVVLGKGARG